MAKFSDHSKIAAISVAGAIIVGAALWYTSRPTQDLADVPKEVAGVPQDTPARTLKPADTTSDEVTRVEEPTPAPEQVVDTVEANETIAPAFDEVRREPDGMTIIAGRAQPGAEVSVMLDGSEISNVTADQNGKFAAITIVSPDGQGHVLSLADAGTPSEGQIILAPIDVPVEVAEVARAEAVDEITEESTGQTAGTLETPADLNNEEAVVVAETAEIVVESDPETQPVQVETIQETQEVAVLKTTDQGVELLNVKPPEVMDMVALDTISYSDQGDVHLAGRAQADTKTVRVYLNNDAVVSLVVDDQGRWRGDLPDVDEGIYTLRVDEVSTSGTVTSRVETPFKREAPEVLAAAVAGQEGPLKKVTVQKGATLWAIAEQRYGSGLLYVNVFNANASSIRNPDLIYPGQVFDLPGD